MNHTGALQKFFRVVLPLVCVCQVVCIMLAACASMGRPEGGPRDTIPPRAIYSNPGDGAVNFKGKRMRVYFDENVQIQDAMNKVVVSPAQITPPAISANGRYVQVEFRDTLRSDMTYTIDFTDAVKDLNEGNVLDGYATAFSTGPVIDSLRISGIVLQASNLEPAQGMLVGAYSDLSDTALTTLPFERITKTNQYGQFTLRNLKPGTYRIFAVNDINRDYHWDRSEDIAFYDSLITPTVSRVVVNDTLRSSAGTDSIVSHEVTAYYPNDILLTWFNLNYRAQYLSKYERPNRKRITLEFGAPSDTLPTMRIVGSGKLNGLTSERWALMTASATRDTLNYWITDTLVSGLDSLTVSLTYLRTDTADCLTERTDTLRLFMRGANTRAAEAKAAAKEAEKRQKAMEKGDTLPPPEIPSLKISSGSKIQDLHLPLTLKFDYPVTEIDSGMVRLAIKNDTAWLPLERPHLTPAIPPVSIEASYVWEPGAEYTLSIDSGAIRGVYGEVNKKFEMRFTTHKLEDYSTIRFNIEPVLPDSVGQIVVELLNRNDVPVARRPVIDGTVLFDYLSPSTYYARAFIDSDRNGLWTQGSIADTIQPEEVAYYPKKLNLKKNWDIEQNWNLYELPLDMQKPLDIKKNKPATRNSNRHQDRYPDEDDEEAEDEFGVNYFERDSRRNGRPGDLQRGNGSNYR